VASCEADVNKFCTFIYYTRTGNEGDFNLNGLVIILAMQERISIAEKQEQQSLQPR
jgi:hypothetical protein